ncbi:hypothetical protein BJY04DRAFT_165423 [Aspergillus karnatakaensis]|uniref:uncharacterized protein n=1 Tax=Aspergillus karnatakaensis TaxID=1810916 RepID=UPI003CCE1EFE
MRKRDPWVSSRPWSLKTARKVRAYEVRSGKRAPYPGIAFLAHASGASHGHYRGGRSINLRGECLKKKRKKKSLFANHGIFNAAKKSLQVTGALDYAPTRR